MNKWTSEKLLTISNLIPGSTVGVWIRNDTDAETLAGYDELPNMNFKSFSLGAQVFLGVVEDSILDIYHDIPIEEWVCLRVRKAGILPFECYIQILNGHNNLTVINTTDTIYDASYASTDSRDFSTIASWEANLEKDAVTGECYGEDYDK